MAKVNFKRPAPAVAAPTPGAMLAGVFGKAKPLSFGPNNPAMVWSEYQPRTRIQKLLEDLRTGGNDPVFRKNMIRSFVIHFIIIFGPAIYAWFFSGVTPYNIMQGSGVTDPAGMAEPQKEVVHQKMKKPKPKKRKSFVLRANSPILFGSPDLDDPNIGEKLEKETSQEYETKGESAQELVQKANETSGGLVKGANGHSAGRLGKGGGKNGGWPDGMGNDPVRFIRLEYSDPSWNDGNEPGARADLNFLAKFEDLAGIKAARKTESNQIYQLNQYPDGHAPPFVYITGRNDINPTGSDIKTLRDYVKNGGMIFGDAGSQRFDQAFRAMVSQVFPGESLTDIADDDPLYTMPNSLPNGAPAVFHHGGFRALGIKQRGRWVVFYHPGSLKDLWRTGGSGANTATVDNSYKLGVNIVYYAFSNYLELNRKKKAASQN